MATPGSYKVNFTDPTKINNTGSQRGFFTINPETTDGTQHPLSSVLDASAVRSETSLLFYGKDVPNYGERIAENFVHLLEHFAGPIAPKNPIHGQIWVRNGFSFQLLDYNIAANTIKIAGDYTSLISSVVSAPAEVSPGVPNPQGTIRIVNVNTLEFIEARPTGAVLVDGSANTQISLTAGTLTGVNPADLLTTANFVTVAANRSSVVWYDDRRMQNGTAGWKTVPGAEVSSTEPDLPLAGEIWLDTSVSPAQLKVHDGVNFNNGFLSLAGGTMTGPILLSSTSHTDPLEATSKSYVDAADAAILASLSGDISTVAADVAALDVRVTTVEGDIVTLTADLAALDAQVTSDISTIQADIVTINNTLVNKLDLSGGTMIGDIGFSIPEQGTSPKITFSGTIGITGYDVEYFSEGDLIGSETRHILKLLAPGSDEESKFVFQYESASDVSATTIFDIRKQGVLAPLGVYEQSSATTLGSALTATNKYQTQSEVSSTIDLVGAFLVSGFETWDGNTKVLTIGTANTSGALSPMNISLDHSHDPGDLSFSYEYLSVSDNEVIPSIDTNVLSLSLTKAISILDIEKAKAKDAELENAAKNYVNLVTLSQTPGSDEVVVLSTDLSNNSVQAGDDVILRRLMAAGSLEIDYNGSSSPGAGVVGTDLTGLDVGSPDPQYDLVLEINYDDINYRVSITEVGSNLTTYNDLVNVINNGIVAAIPQSPAIAVASITNGNLLIETSETGPHTSVDIINNEMIIATTPFLASPSPTFVINRGVDNTATIVTSIDTITPDTPVAGQSTVTFTNTLSGFTADQIAVMSVASISSLDYELVTRKDMIENAVPAGSITQSKLASNIQGPVLLSTTSILGGTVALVLPTIFSDNPTYRYFKIQMEEVVSPSATNEIPSLRVSIDGSTWRSTAGDYTWGVVTTISSDGGETSARNTADTSIQLTSLALTSSSTVTGSVVVMNPHSTTSVTPLTSDLVTWDGADGVARSSAASSFIATTDNLTGFRLFWSAGGTFQTGGEIKVYGSNMPF